MYYCTPFHLPGFFLLPFLQCSLFLTLSLTPVLLDLISSSPPLPFLLLALLILLPSTFSLVSFPPYSTSCRCRSFLSVPHVASLYWCSLFPARFLFLLQPLNKIPIPQHPLNLYSIQFTGPCMTPCFNLTYRLLSNPSLLIYTPITLSRPLMPNTTQPSTPTAYPRDAEQG